MYLVGANRFEVPFPKLQTFSGIFWVLPIDYSQYEKTILRIFVDLFICKVTTTKVNFVFTNKTQYVLFANEPFLVEMLEWFLSSNIPVYI